MPVKFKILGGITLILLITVSIYKFYFVSSYKPVSPNFIPSLFTTAPNSNRIISIKLLAEPVQTDSEINNLTAHISMPFEFIGDLHYKWSLGEGVTLQNGDLSGKFENLSKDEVKSINLSVRGFSKETNHHIKFEVYAVKNQKRIYGEALVASDRENTFENTVQNVEKIKSEQ